MKYDFETVLNKKSVSSLILDLDNCLIDSREWNKYLSFVSEDNPREGWDLFREKYFLAKPNEEMVKFLEQLVVICGLKTVYFVTSRENAGNMRKYTHYHIKQALGNNLIFKNIKFILLMRDENDYRTAPIVKKDLLSQIDDKFDLAIDDDVENIAMYEELGIDTIYYTELLK